MMRFVKGIFRPEGSGQQADKGITDACPCVRRADQPDVCTPAQVVLDQPLRRAGAAQGSTQRRHHGMVALAVIGVDGVLPLLPEDNAVRSANAQPGVMD